MLFHGPTRHCAGSCNFQQGYWGGQAQDFDIISKLPPPLTDKGVQSFLGHARFCALLVKDVKFEWTEKCMDAFNTLKKLLPSTPIMMAPDWSLLFELICDVSDFALGDVLGQRIDKVPHTRSLGRTWLVLRLLYSLTMLLWDICLLRKMLSLDWLDRYSSCKSLILRLGTERVVRMWWQIIYPGPFMKKKEICFL